MLTGKYWITPQGVIDVTTNEHALYARKIMLGLPPENYRYQFPNMFDALSAAETKEFRERGVPEKILNFLSEPRNDPRVFAIENWDWIRVRQHAFYLWINDARARLAIRNAADYWETQTQIQQYDMVELAEISSGTTTTIPLQTLRG